MHAVHRRMLGWLIKEELEIIAKEAVVASSRYNAFLYSQELSAHSEIWTKYFPKRVVVAVNL
jgi:hypothetical protein